MTCLGCTRIEAEPVTVGAKVYCKGCPSVDARILWGMDLLGRRAALVRIGETRGAAVRAEVEAILKEMWKDRDGEA
jgi:hypothetical protein